MAKKKNGKPGRKPGRDVALTLSLLGNLLFFLGKLPDLQKAIRDSGLVSEPVTVIRFATHHPDLKAKGEVQVATADDIQLLGTDRFEKDMTLPKQVGGYKAKPRLQYLNLPPRAFRYTSEPQVISIDDTFSLQGRIVWGAKTGPEIQGIAGAVISVDGRTGVSDTTGSYLIEGLPPRTKYEISVCLKGVDECLPSDLRTFMFNPTGGDTSLHTYNITIPRG